MWKTVLIACLVLCTCQAGKSPVFLVTFPAVINVGSEAKLCASVFHTPEALNLTILLKNGAQSTVLLHQVVEQGFHRCLQFQVPRVHTKSVQFIEAELRGTSFHMMDKKKVLFMPKDSLRFIRTDKPVYKRGQTVHIRIFSVDLFFEPVREKYDLLELENPYGQIIEQWVNTTSNGRFLQLSYPLSSNAILGGYKLFLHNKGEHVRKNFRVTDYVPPRLEAYLLAPSSINVLEKFVKIGICANYTHGKPVTGMAVLKLCREYLSYVEPPPNETAVCHEEFTKVNDSGCATHVFSLSHFVEIQDSDLKNSLHYTAKIEDEGTGVILKKSAYINLECKIGKIFFELSEEFKIGSIVEGKIKPVYYNNTPMANIPIYLSSWEIGLFQNLTTDINGTASFSINRTGLSSVSLEAKLHHGQNFPSIGCLFLKGTFHIMYFDSAAIKSEVSPEPLVSNTRLTIELVDYDLLCGQKQQFTVQYTLSSEQAAEGPVDLKYLVLSKGVIFYHGLLGVPFQHNNVTQGQTSFPLLITHDMAPKVQLLVYALFPNGQLVADSKSFDTERCFKNKVSLQFSAEQAVPGENVALQLSASPGSLCGLTTLDQSVMSNNPDLRLNSNKIFEMDQFYSPKSMPFSIDEWKECVHVRFRRSTYHKKLGRTSEYSLFLFQELGLKTLTNLPKPLPTCLTFNGRSYEVSNWMYPQQTKNHYYPLDNSGEKQAQTLFPETWVWDLIEVGESGSTMINLTVPDTIFSWETEVVCLSIEGMGLASPKQLTVSQPFLLELSLPYSIIHGEHFELKATVFHNEPKCIMVTVTVTPSTKYTIMPMAGSEYSECVCQWKTFSWTLIPSVLGTVNVTVTAEAVQSQTICGNEVVSVPEKGHVNTVTRPLLVKAEGIEKLTSHGWLLCPNGTPLKEEIQLQFPVNMVGGSGHSTLSVVGDILGRALQNLDDMLAVPYDCGEQNMAVLASSIYILQYLSATKQLTPAVLQQATVFLKTGYQRQMRYQHVNGAFSSFGQGTVLNSWLTAFVMRSFSRMQSFVYVNPNTVKDAKIWLESQQKTDGCFQTEGKLFNNRVEDEVTENVIMTGYITASLLEMNVSVTNPVLARSLACLRNAAGDLTSTYATALLAYTFSLAKETDTHQRLLHHLNAVASSEGGFLYWSPPNSDASSSLSVEMTSYVLLALLSHPRYTDDLGQAARIVSWLMKQQNPQGGFFSSQDTVVALQALSLYATLTYNTKSSTTVTVQSSAKEMHQFQVDQSNRLLYQESVLHHIPGQYTIEAQGTGCVSVQIALHYTVPPPPDASTFDVKVQTEGNCTSTRRRMLHLHVKYNGARNISNMVIVDASMLSGFIPEEEQLQELEENSVVGRVVTKNDHVLLYLDGIPQNTPKNITIELRQEFDVENLKPAVVKVYDYYQPSDHVVTEYTFKCA